MSLKRTDNPQDFFNDLDRLFRTTEFQSVLDKYIYGNIDYDIFSMIFIVYFMIFIQTKDKSRVSEIVKNVLKNKNKRRSLVFRDLNKFLE